MKKEISITFVAILTLALNVVYSNNVKSLNEDWTVEVLVEIERFTGPLDDIFQFKSSFIYSNPNENDVEINKETFLSNCSNLNENGCGFGIYQSSESIISAEYDANTNTYIFLLADSWDGVTYYRSYENVFGTPEEILISHWKNIFKLTSNLEYWQYPTDGDVFYSNFVYGFNDFNINVFNNPILSAFPFNDSEGDDLGVYYPRPFAKISYIPDSRYEANVYLFPGLGDDEYFNKVLLVGDPFDPRNKRDAFKIYDNNQFKKLLSTSYTNGARAKGYDVIFINFAQGGGNIVINAAMELAVTQWLETKTQNKYVIGGLSMSGVIGRLSLLMGQKNDIINNCKGFLTIDSPHQGASISTSFQKAVGSIKFDCDASFLGSEPTDEWYDLNTPASWQMIYGHIRKGGGIYGDCGDKNFYSTTGGHEMFYEYLFNMGDYPKNIPLVSIAYSDFHKPHGTPIISDREVGMVDPPLSIADRHFSAGGNEDSPNWHEFMPGSIGDWYYSTYSNEYGQFMDLYNFNGEMYNGTFIPIYSALDLRNNFNRLYPQTINEKELATYSPFDKVMWMTDQNRRKYDGRNVMRYEHIVCDDQLMERLIEGLEYIEMNQKINVVPTIITLLLLN